LNWEQLWGTITESRRTFFGRAAIALLLAYLVPLPWLVPAEADRPPFFAILFAVSVISLAPVVHPGPWTRHKLFPYAWGGLYVLLTSLLIRLSGGAQSPYYLIFFLIPVAPISLGSAIPVGLFLAVSTIVGYLSAINTGAAAAAGTLTARLTVFCLATYFLVRYKLWVRRLYHEIDMQRAASRVSDAADSLEEILRFLVGYLSEDCLSVTAYFLIPNGEGKLYSRAAIGPHANVSIPPIAEDAGLIGQAVRSRRQIYVPDVEKDPNYCALLPDTRSELVIPLTLKGAIVGVLNLECSQADGFPRTYRRLFYLLGPQIALIVRNSQLFSDVGQRLAENQQILSSMLDAAHHLVSTAEELASSTSEVSAATEEVAATTQQVTRGAESQASLIEAANHTLQELVHAAREISISADTTGELLSQTDQLAQTTEGAFTELLKSAAAIRKISHLTRRLSDQINLVSLNATIEAARAGEYGKGFAVIADEVRELADLSKDSVNQISELTENLVEATSNLAPLMHDLRKAVKESASHVKAIARATGEQEQGAEAAGEYLQKVTHEAELHATAAEQVGAIVEQVAASLASIAQSADLLANLAAELRQVAGKNTQDES